MLLDRYLTEYDEDLTGDVYIDPLGVLVIWSAYGQEIFQNKVNSISNDVRNYTLNLINHAIIKSLIDDESVTLKPALINAIGDKKSLQFKQACFIYLENIFTYSVSIPDIPEGVNSIGVLGSTKARKSWYEEGEDPAIFFSDKEKSGGKRYHLLVRQLGLGVSGRYKTPFSTIGFFDSQYDYRCPGADKVWDKVDQLFEDSTLMKSVFDRARLHLLWLFENHTVKKQMPPKIHFSAIPDELIDAYQKALPNSSVAGRETRDFWLEVTNLNEGAAGALLSELEFYSENGNEDWKYLELFSNAEKNESLTDESRQKLTNIQIIEPLLSEIDLLFLLARHRKNHSVKDVIENWRKLGRNDKTLPSLAQKVIQAPGVKAVVSGMAATRLNLLLSSAMQESLEHQIIELLDYHKRVMRIRGQQPWVELIGEETLKVHARTAEIPDGAARPLDGWVNNYYIPQFKNLVEGFRGVVE